MRFHCFLAFLPFLSPFLCFFRPRCRCVCRLNEFHKNVAGLHRKTDRIFYPSHLLTLSTTAKNKINVSVMQTELLIIVFFWVVVLFRHGISTDIVAL